MAWPVFLYRYGQEFKQLLARDPKDESKYKDHETLLSFYTEDVMRAAEREVRPERSQEEHIGKLFSNRYRNATRREM